MSGVFVLDSILHSYTAAVQHTIFIYSILPTYTLFYSYPSDTFGTARKFQAGKQAKKAAQIYSEMKQRAAASSSTSQYPTDEEVDSELRGPSLMELHHKQKAEAAVKAVDATGASIRRPFDREKDVLRFVIYNILIYMYMYTSFCVVYMPLNTYRILHH